MQTLGILAMTSMFLLICFSQTSGADYYVSNSGDDANSGTTPTEAWKTLAKVNDFKFSPRDNIHFERGGVWRGQLIPHSGGKEGHIMYASYGPGPKPLLLGSVEKNKPNDWMQMRLNIWQTTPFPVDVGSIIFNNGETCGVKVWEGTDLDKQNEFCFDRKTKVVKMYSARNPAEIYDDIECALKRHIINQGGRHYVVYDGLHLAYGAAHGIGGGGTHHIVVRNCDLCFIGGGHQFSKKTKRGVHHVRYGNGIEFWGSAHDNLVENCSIWDIYDAGLTNQGGSKNQQYNIIYRNNVIWNCEYSFEYWNRPETSVTHDIYFENNICFNAGRGWSDGQPYNRGEHLMFFDNSAKTYNFYVRNNVFHLAADVAISIRADRWNGLDKLVIDDNLYYQPPDKRLVLWGGWRDGKPFLARQFQTYKEFTGKDANSRLATPKRLVVASEDLRVSINDTKPLKAVLLYSAGPQLDVTYWTSFTSSEPAIVSVEDEGAIGRLRPSSPQLKGLRPGKAAVTATFEGLTAIASVTVSR